MKLGCCIDMMFSGTEFYERFAAVKQCGFPAVEFWKWSNKNIDLVAGILAESGLELSIFNLDSGDSALSADLMRGILCDGRETDFIKALKDSIPVYQRWNASGMIILLGERRAIALDEQKRNAIRVLKTAAKIAEENNITLLVEPLNDIDRKNYAFPTVESVAEIIREVDSPNVKLLFDLYHEYSMTGTVIEKIEKYSDITGHYHIADAPGRHEPGTGKMNYREILKEIEKNGYTGYVGLEYRATQADENTFDFVKEYLK